MISIEFSPQAQRDLQKIKRWYNRKQKGLGVSFVHEIDSKLQGLLNTPLMHGVYFQDIRRAPIHIFPYTILYRVSKELVEIVAICHHKQDIARIVKKRING